MKNDVVKNLEFVMKLRKVSKKELAKKLGITDEGMRLILKGKRGISCERIFELSDILKVAPEVFFFDFSKFTEEENQEIIAAYCWIKNQSPEVRKKIMKFGISSYEIYMQEVMEKPVFISKDIKKSLQNR